MRQPHLDGLRGLAALYVVLHHAWLQVWPLGHFPYGKVLAATGWLLYGHFAVSVFIVLSGYCLTLPVVRHGTDKFASRSFLKRRAWRILPPYYFSVLFTAILIFTYIGQKTGTHWDLSLPPTPGKFSRVLLLLPDTGLTINNVYWSIGVECKIYLLFPLIVALFGRIGVLWTAAAAAATGFVAAFLLRHSEYSLLSPQYVGLFCFGAAASYIVNSPEVRWMRLRDSRLWMPCTIASAAVFVVLCGRTGFAPQRFFAIDLVAGITAATTLIVCREWRLLNWKPLVFVGTFSYSLYLVHAPLLQVIWQAVVAGNFSGHVSRFFALCTIGVPFILISAWAFYHVCERPFIPRSR